MIAGKLKQRYGEKLVLWHYSIEDYNNVKSREKLAPSRIKKLERVKSKELYGIKDALIKEGSPGYHELLTDRYIEDILT